MSTAVIFDMDGTLFDTEAVFQKYWNAIAKERGIVLPDAFKYEICGTSGEVMIRIIEKQYRVKDGMEIEIQLKATRGEEGTTAIIDIVPQKPKTPRGSRTSGEVPAKAEPAKAAAPAKAEPAQAVAESVAEAEADDAEQVAEQAQEPEALEPAPVEAEEAPRKSLFAGLSKPQN